MIRNTLIVLGAGAATLGCLPPGDVTEANIEALAKWCEPVAVSCAAGYDIVEDVSGWTDQCYAVVHAPGPNVGAFISLPIPTTCPPSNPRLYTAIGADDCRCY